MKSTQINNTCNNNKARHPKSLLIASEYYKDTNDDYKMNKRNPNLHLYLPYLSQSSYPSIQSLQKKQQS